VLVLIGLFTSHLGGWRPRRSPRVRCAAASSRRPRRRRTH